MRQSKQAPAQPKDPKSILEMSVKGNLLFRNWPDDHLEKQKGFLRYFDKSLGLFVWYRGRRRNIEYVETWVGPDGFFGTGL